MAIRACLELHANAYVLSYENPLMKAGFCFGGAKWYNISIIFEK